MTRFPGHSSCLGAFVVSLPGNCVTPVIEHCRAWLLDTDRRTGEHGYPCNLTIPPEWAILQPATSLPALCPPNTVRRSVGWAGGCPAKKNSQRRGSGRVAVKAGSRESGSGGSPIPAPAVNGPGSCPPNVKSEEMSGFQTSSRRRRRHRYQG